MGNKGHEGVREILEGNKGNTGISFHLFFLTLKIWLSFQQDTR